MVNQATPVPQPHDWLPSADQAYINNASLHLLPIDVWRYIGEFVATGKTPTEAAFNEVVLGEVGKLFHVFAHEHAVGPIVVEEYNTSSMQPKFKVAYDHWGKELSRVKLNSHHGHL